MILQERCDDCVVFRAGFDTFVALHVTRFFPKWKMKDRNATDIGQVYELAEIAQRNLAYVYTGNCCPAGA